MLCGRILGRHRFLQARSQSSERRSLIPRLFHADTGSTERYVHLADQHVPDAAGRIGGIVDGAMSDAPEVGGWAAACGRPRRAGLSLKAVQTVRPQGSEYALWDGSLPHFGL